MKVINGQRVQPNDVLSYTYFAVIKDRFYQETQDSQTKEEITKLLVLKRCQEMLFQAALHKLMAGALGAGYNTELAETGQAFALMFTGGVHHVADVSW